MEGIITQLDDNLEQQIFPIFQELQDIGVVHMGHGIIKKNFVPTAIYTHKEWAVKYKNEEYFRADPLRQYALKTNFRLIPWKSLVIEGTLEQKILDERMRICSSKKGILIANRSPDLIETFVLGTDSKRLDLISILFNKFVKIRLNQISEIHKSIYQ